MKRQRFILVISYKGAFFAALKQSIVTMRALASQFER